MTSPNDDVALPEGQLTWQALQRDLGYVHAESKGYPTYELDTGKKAMAPTLEEALASLKELAPNAKGSTAAGSGLRLSTGYCYHIENCETVSFFLHRQRGSVRSFPRAVPVRLLGCGPVSRLFRFLPHGASGGTPRQSIGQGFSWRG